MDKLHGTPKITNWGSPYTTNFFLFFNAFEFCSSMKSFILDTFVFNIFERCKIIIYSFILHKIHVDVFEFYKKLVVLEGPSLFFWKLFLVMYLQKFNLFYKVHYILVKAVIFPCIASRFMQLGLTYLSFGNGQCVLQKTFFFTFADIFTRRNLGFFHYPNPLCF
jgi:hypothetical protein